MTTNIPDTKPTTELKIGRVRLIAWTVPVWRADHHELIEMVSAYYPIGDKEFPDGLMLIGDRATEAKSRDAAIAEGLVLLGKRLADNVSIGGSALKIA